MKADMVSLWDAISRVVTASGGDAGCTSNERQQAVVEVESVIAEMLAHRLRDAETIERELSRAAHAVTSYLHPLRNTYARQERLARDLAIMIARRDVEELERRTRAAAASVDLSLLRSWIEKRKHTRTKEKLEALGYARALLAMIERVEREKEGETSYE